MGAFQQQTEAESVSCISNNKTSFSLVKMTQQSKNHMAQCMSPICKNNVVIVLLRLIVEIDKAKHVKVSKRIDQAVQSHTLCPQRERERVLYDRCIQICSGHEHYQILSDSFQTVRSTIQPVLSRGIDH